MIRTSGFHLSDKLRKLQIDEFTGNALFLRICGNCKKYRDKTNYDAT
jgi:hypothetical protein